MVVVSATTVVTPLPRTIKYSKQYVRTSYLRQMTYLRWNILVRIIYICSWTYSVEKSPWKNYTYYLLGSLAGFIVQVDESRKINSSTVASFELKADDTMVFGILFFLDVKFQILSGKIIIHLFMPLANMWFIFL